MINKSLLEQAVKKNIIEQHQLEPLYEFLLEKGSSDLSVVKEEPLRFIRSFGDVFIALGIILLVLAINKAGVSGYLYYIAVAFFIGLSEWLVRLRKLALPGIAILLSILYFVNKAIPFQQENSAMLGLGALSLASLLFYLRYKMPFSLLPLAAGLVSMVVISLGFDVLKNPLIFVVLGLVIFTVAFWFDSRDTRRQSHLSDNAFWLYLLASPLMVHGIMVSFLLSEQSWLQSINKEFFMLVFFACFFLLALLIDRRAILVSTQLYVIYALSQLFKNNINSTEDVMIYILAGLGLFVIYFGTYWYKTRRIIFGFVEGTVLSRYIPPLTTRDLK